MSTAALAAALAPSDGTSSAVSASLATCLTSSTMLPRPSPLHTADDLAALTAAAKAALAAAAGGHVSEEARTVLGGVETAEQARELLAASLRALDAYERLRSTGGFATDGEADAAAAGCTGAKAFATWAFRAAASRGVSTLVVYGGSGWWANLIKELRGTSEGLDASMVDALLPELAICPAALGADGSPLQVPLLAPPAGARYVRLVRHADGGVGLALPSECALAALNPPGRAEGAEREGWLRGLLSSGECCSY